MIKTVISDAEMSLDVQLYMIDNYDDMFAYVTSTYPNCPHDKAAEVAYDLITWAENKRTKDEIYVSGL
jgi:hypothetical protein